MKFTVDECRGPSVALWLKSLGHDVFSVYDDARGLSDEKILKRSFSEKRIVITNDKDFGELIFKKNQTHFGIIFLRLKDERIANKINVLNKLLNNINPKSISGKFLVVTEKTIRIS